MSFRPCVLVVTGLAACATASTPAQQQGTPDAPRGTSDAPGGADAPGGGDGMPPHIDAAIDAPPGSCATPFSGALATWDLTSQAGNQASSNATASATGVTAGPISRSTGLVAQTGAMSINASGWPTAATLDATKYFTFSVTPPSGCLMDLTQLSINEKSSSTGPASAAVGTSADSFAATTPITINALSTPVLSVTGASGAIELRVYGYAATSASGTMRIQNTLTVSGTLR